MARYSRVALYRVQNSAHNKHGNPVYFRKSKYNPEQIVSIPEAQREEPNLPGLGVKAPDTNAAKPGPPAGHPGFPGMPRHTGEPVLKKNSVKRKTSKTAKKTGAAKKAASTKKAASKKTAPKKAAKKMASKKMSAKKTTTMKKVTGTKKAAAKKSTKTKK